jgi:hypothetical protein
MRKYFVAIGIASLAAAAMPASVNAAGGARGALLDPTVDAIACTAELAVPNCESQGYGAAATLSIGRANYIGFNLTNLIAGQTYLAANNDVGLESCAGVLTTFAPTADGSVDFTVPVSAAAEFVSICREAEGVLVPVLTGQMARLNGR